MGKELILEGGSGRKIELDEVQDLQIDVQDIPQSVLPIDKVQS